MENSNNLSIGSQILNKKGGARFEGEILRHENLTEEIYAGTASIALHENGIKLWNTHYPKSIEIHHSQLINLEYTTRSELTESKRPFIMDVLFGILVIITLGFILSNVIASSSSEDGTKGRNYIISDLDIHYRVLHSETIQTISISGKKRRIHRFIERYDELN